MFLMSLCRELGITLSEGMNMTVFELKCWAAFFKIDNQRTKEQMNRGRRNTKN